MIARNKKGQFVKGCSREKAARWKGGRWIQKVRQLKYCFVYDPDHHFNIKKYVLEHRLVWENHNKAVLLPWADIHHKNGNTLDNRIENLELMSHSQHRLIHVKEDWKQGKYDHLRILQKPLDAVNKKLD
jgi:hypothetical protein